MHSLPFLITTSLKRHARLPSDRISIVVLRLAGGYPAFTMIVHRSKYKIIRLACGPVLQTFRDGVARQGVPVRCTAETESVELGPHAVALAWHPPCTDREPAGHARDILLNRVHATRTFDRVLGPTRPDRVSLCESDRCTL